jgi:RNA polymerase sigma-70 factor (family 1)
MNVESSDIVLFQQGNAKAFDEIFYQFYPSVIGFARKLTKNAEVAEEIAMDSFRKLWTRRESFDNKSSIKAWLMITTKNACYSYLYEEKRKMEKEKEFVDFKMKDPEDDPDYPTLKEAIITKLHEEINALPPQCRAVIKYRLQGYNNARIAKILGVSTFTVRNQASAAFKKLRFSLLNVEQLIICILLLRQLF